MHRLSGRRKKHKKVVYAIVLITAAMLIFTSAAGYYGFRSAAPRTGDASRTIEQVIVDLKDRISQLESSLEMSPDDLNLLEMLADSYYQLGIAYYHSGEAEASRSSFAKALEPYGRALELNPQDVDVRVDRAVAAFQSNNLDLAEQEFKRAISLDPQHAQAYFNYGVFLHIARDRTAEAIAQWRQVIKLNPVDDQQLVSVARQWIAQVEGERQPPPPTPPPQN